MTAFGELPEITSGLIGGVFFILYLGMIFLLVRGISLKRPGNFLRSVGFILGMILTYSLLQCCMGVYDNMLSVPVIVRLLDEFAKTPAIAVLLVCLLLLIIEIIIIYRDFKWDQTHITAVSIKEAVDSIPAGVCAYEKCGRVVLKNATMDRLSKVFTGEILLNGLLLEEGMKNFSNKDIMGEKEVYILPDDSVCIFSKETHSIDGHELTLLTVYDMTEEYNKSQILLQKRRAVEKLNSKLVEYNRDIVSIITAQEILNAKVKIHDELGAGLLAIKNYIVNGGGADKKAEIIKKLNGNLKFLLSEIADNRQDEYILIFSTANALDVRIIVDGNLPEDEPGKHIMATAIHECFTNTLRHAKGDLLNIKVEEDVPDNMVTVIFTNNGDRPKEPIVEKGGLVSLRSLVETNGGIMKIETESGFELSISLPREGKHSEMIFGRENVYEG